MSKKKGRKKKKPNERAGQGPETDVPFPADPRAMESVVSDIARLLEEQDFESEEEASAFLDDLIQGGLPPRPKPTTPLEKAQELIYQALNTDNERKRVQLARKALRTSEDCADAYVLLAEETAKTPEEARELYDKGVAAGERALGQEMFEEEEGNFWGIVETRPYMRARHGLALALWELGERQEALEHYTALLRLNPDDNQGIRYLLALALLDEDSDEPLGELLERYEDDASAMWLYTRALWTFRKEGATKEATTTLEEALGANPFVPLYLLGRRRLLDALPEISSFEDEGEAVAYVAETLAVWLRTPGVLEWLRETDDTFEPPVQSDDYLWDEEDEEFITALEAEEEETVGWLRRALPEHVGVEPPSEDLEAAVKRLRARFESEEWPYEHMMQATGWEDLPGDDLELWLGAAGSLISPREATGLEPELEASIVALQLGDWLGAVIGLTRAGVGASASPDALVSYIDDCPEVEGEVDPEEAALVETAFELVLPAWEAVGAVDDRRRLTALGRWGLPRALAWAWDHDFDSGLPL